MFVLDAQRNAITVFELTPYGETLHTAIDIYTDGRYQDSLPYWYEILKYNSLSVLANRGIGKALYQVGESEKAVEYFEKCNDTDRVFQRLRGYPQGGNPGQLLRYRAGTRAADSRGLAV